MSAIMLFSVFPRSQEHVFWPHHLFLIQTWEVNSCPGRRLMHTCTLTHTHTHTCTALFIKWVGILNILSMTIWVILYLLQFVSSVAANVGSFRGPAFLAHSIIIEITVGHKASHLFFICSVFDCIDWRTHSKQSLSSTCWQVAQCTCPSVCVCVCVGADVCAAEFVRGKGVHKRVHQQGCLCFHRCLYRWISSAVFNAGATDGLCFISRLVGGAWSGVPRSTLICCQIFINVTALRPPNDASMFCEGPCSNEPVGSLGVRDTEKDFQPTLTFVANARALANICSNDWN